MKEARDVERVLALFLFLALRAARGVLHPLEQRAAELHARLRRGFLIALGREEPTARCTLITGVLRRCRLRRCRMGRAILLGQDRLGAEQQFVVSSLLEARP